MLTAGDGAALTSTTWRDILASAFTLFDDAEARGFGTPPFSLGGGTVLMLRFEHRLSKDINLFGYDAQWLSVLSPRLSAAAAALVSNYAEQANTIKLVMGHGDIDFIVAADVALPVERTVMMVAGRWIEVDPVSEILAKKLFYRAASFKPRDVYDLSAALEVAPAEASKALDATSTKADILLRRLDELATLRTDELVRDIIPYDGILKHADGMVDKVRRFVVSRGGMAGSRSGAHGP